jgi:hypothetical protein
MAEISLWSRGKREDAYLDNCYLAATILDLGINKGPFAGGRAFLSGGAKWNAADLIRISIIRVCWWSADNLSSGIFWLEIMN